MYSDEIKKFKIKRDAVILAIESSCDETAAAIIKNGREILSSEISSSCTEHIRFGGVVPEIASRAHTSAISLTVRKAVDKANIDLKDIDAVAVTYGAGLLGALVAIVATIIPPFVIITVISYFYELFRDNFIVSKLLAGMQAGVGAVIASVVWDMGGGVVKQKSAVSDFIMLAAFLAACVFRVNVVYIILACIALGVLRTVLAKRRKGA